MAKYIFKNNKTGETKIISSKDSATAKRVYSNKTWSYVKPIAKKDCPTITKRTAIPSRAQLFMLTCQLASAIIELRDQARDYDVRFAQTSASQMEDYVSKMQSILR